VQKLIDSAASAPEIPQLDMLQGTYVKLTNVKFKASDEHFGNSIYYTTNNEAPDEFSKIYRGGFPIESTSDLRAVSYNSNGDASEIGLYSFTIDKTMLESLTTLIDSAKELLDNTEVGAEIGQCSDQTKDRLSTVVNNAESLLEQDNVLFMDAENYVDYLNAAIEEFNSHINTSVTKADFEALIENADEIHTAVSKASIANNVTEELAALGDVIEDCKNTTDEQNAIDVGYYTLYQSLLSLNKAGYKAAYKALLISNNSNSYIIYDVNDDTIPELILNQGTNSENYLYTYSVSQGEAVRVKTDDSFGTIAKFYKHHDGILGCSTTDDNGDFHLITFVDNKIEISDKLDEYNTNATLRTSLSAVDVNIPSSTAPIEEY
jgi:hypothetical protein